MFRIILTAITPLVAAAMAYPLATSAARRADRKVARRRQADLAAARRF